MNIHLAIINLSFDFLGHVNAAHLQQHEHYSNCMYKFSILSFVWVELLV